MRFSNRNCIVCFCLFVAARETEKWKKANNPTKIVLLRWLSKNEKDKNGFLATLPDTICVKEGRQNARFRAHYLFWPNFLGPKQ